MKAGRIRTGALTVTGKSIGENNSGRESLDARIIRTYSQPLKENAGFLVMSGNLFESALLKTSVISADFRQRYLADGNAFTCRAVVFEGPEDYKDRINDPALNIDDRCILVIRGVGPIGYPGSAEVVNMQPPDALIKAGINQLPTLGDGRQSGTCATPSLLNASPESAVGGNLAILETGDLIRIDLNTRRVDLLVDDAEIERRREAMRIAIPEHQTPWQQLYREHVGQLGTGGCLEFAVSYRNVGKEIPRHSH
jgi:dihydroxy-acid dehydratase